MILDPSIFQLRAENVVCCWPHLWVPSGYGDGPKSYSTELIYDPSNPSHAAQMKEIHDMTGALLRSEGKPESMAQAVMPLKDGNLKNADRARQAKEPRPELENKWVMRVADSSIRPVVFDQSGVPMDESLSANVFSGCIIHCVFQLYWRTIPTNPGVSAGLRSIMLVDNVNVKRLGGGAPSVDTMRGWFSNAPKPVAAAPANPGPAPWEPAVTPGTGDGPSWM